MTPEEKKKMLDGFKKPAKQDDTDDWTETEVLAALKRIMERLGLKDGR